MDNPFRHGWSRYLERLQLPRRLEASKLLWKRAELRWNELVDHLTALGPQPPTVGHHTHYCEECDRHWVHDAHVCAVAWAAPCADRGHESAGTERRRLGRWLVVVCRARAELCEQLTESFGDNERVTVLVDRRRHERRSRAGPGASIKVERRHVSDRRAPAPDRDGQVWEALGFRPHRARS